MFARQLIQPPLQGSAQPEIPPVQRQHRFRQDGLEQPGAQRHLHLHHAPAPRLAHDLPILDQAKAPRHLMVARGQVGGDAGARQPLERLAQPAVGIAAGLAVGGQQQVMRPQMQMARHRVTGIQPRHDLAGAIDQDVLVMDGGPALDRRHDLDLDTVMGIAQNRQIRPGGQREQRMLHAGEIRLGQGIKHIAGKKIRLDCGRPRLDAG